MVTGMLVSLIHKSYLGELAHAVGVFAELEPG